FFRADSCALVTVDPLSNVASLRRASREEGEQAARAEQLPAEVAKLLLAPRSDEVFIYCVQAAPRWGRSRTICRAVASAATSGNGSGNQDRDEDPNAIEGPEPEEQLECALEARRKVCEAIAAALD